MNNILSTNEFIYRIINLYINRIIYLHINRNVVFRNSSGKFKIKVNTIEYKLKAWQANDLNNVTYNGV